MAGTLKPNNVKKEGKWLVNGFKAHTATTINSLFDGQRGSWNSGKAFYWLSVGDYIEITLFQTSAIWVLPNLDYLNYNAPLIVSKWDGGSFVSIENAPPRPITDTWSRMTKLDAGRYRFTLASGYRLDDEWYIEEINDKNLLLSNNKTYSLETLNEIYETKMTSNTAPAPLVASSSSAVNTSTQAYKAFDGQASGGWSTVGGDVIDGFLQIDFGEAKKTNEVAIASADFSASRACAPKDFNILGSANGIDFTLILEVKDETNWDLKELRSFKFRDSDYRFYRIQIKSNNNNNLGQTHIGEVLFSYTRKALAEIPSLEIKNFTEYGQSELKDFNLPLSRKDYVLQNIVSENEQGLWTTQLNRKPLSIKFD